MVQSVSTCHGGDGGGRGPVVGCYRVISRSIYRVTNGSQEKPFLGVTE